MRLLIDGREHVVHNRKVAPGIGWTKVAVAPADDRPHLVHAEVGLPTNWLLHARTGDRVRTGGHVFTMQR